MKVCVACRTANPLSARFCFSCGAEISPTPGCPECGCPLPGPDVRFCPTCGARLRKETEEEHLLKLVSVVFADVVGSTTRAEQMFPDEVRELMASFFDAMTEEIRREGGRVEKLIGDALMAVFGVPRIHEDDALRAVRAARNMLARLEQWNTGRPELERIRIRIGVNTGDVFAGATFGQDFMITGDAVNVAARLEAAAPEMSVLIGARTERAVRSHYVLEEVEPLSLKGKSTPVRAFLVGDERVVAQERGVPGLSAPMVGRETELEVLTEALRRVEAEESPHVVTVSAEAGTGKSRLVREFLSSVRGRVKIVTGRCLPYGSGVTLSPLGEILRAEAGIAHNDPPETALKKIEKLVRSSVPPEVSTEFERVVTGLAITIGLADELNLGQRLDPRERFGALLHSWNTLLRAFGVAQPLVVVIDDIHWADPTMLEVIDRLSADLEAPVLFVCPTRPDVFELHEEWGKAAARHTTLTLAPLSDNDSALLVWHLLGMVNLPDEVRALITSKAEGNPFYLEETLRQLIDEGRILPAEGRWSFAGSIEDLRVPDSVQGVIQARIDLLAPEVRRVVQQAAVMGRVFWSGALGTDDPESALDELERRQLIFKSTGSQMSGEDEFVFKHILVRDVAYETLPRKQRARAHVAVADWVKQVSGSRAEEHSEVLAHHYHQAFTYSKKDPQRIEARRLYGVAARTACRRFAMQQAERHGWLVVDLSSAGSERVDALEELGDMLCQSLSIDGAWQVYRDALGELEAITADPAPEQRRHLAARLCAKAASAPTRWSGALRSPIDPAEIEVVIKNGLRAAGRADSRERCLLLASRAVIRAEAGHASGDLGETDARTALGIADRLSDPDLMSAAVDALNNWLLPKGLYGEINTVNRRRLDLVDQMTDLTEVCDTYGVAGWTAAFVGRYDEAERFAGAYVDRARGVDPGNYLLGLVDRVHARFMTGNWDGALADQAEIERIHNEGAEELPAPHTWLAYAVVLFIHQLRGNLQRSAGYETLLGLFDKSELAGSEGPTMRHALWSRALAQRGEAEQARALLRTEPSAVLSAHLESLCELTARLQDWSSARAVVEDSRAEARRAGLLALDAYADRLEGLLLSAQGQPSDGADLLARSVTRFHDLGAPFEEGLSLLAYGEALSRSGDPAATARVQSARTIFERLGAASEIARADDLLASLRTKTIDIRSESSGTATGKTKGRLN